MPSVECRVCSIASQATRGDRSGCLHRRLLPVLDVVHVRLPLDTTIDELGGSRRSGTFLERDLCLLKVTAVRLGTEDHEDHHPSDDRADEDALDRGVVGRNAVLRFVSSSPGRASVSSNKWVDSAGLPLTEPHARR
jgi:hypothetical protein